MHIVFMYIYINIYMYMYIYIHTYTYIHIYRCVFFNAWRDGKIKRHLDGHV
jgi:hypothetical protein